MRRTASTLIALVVALLALGLVMLASTSSVRGAAAFDDAGFFFKRQALWLVFGLAGAVATATFDYHWWRRRDVAIGLAVLAVALLVLVLVPGIGVKVGGSRRWLRLGRMSLQASEVAKFAVVVAMANWMVLLGRRTATLRDGLLLPLTGLGVVLALLLLEPDFGTTLLIGATGMLLMYAGGTRVSHLVIAATGGLCLFTLAVMRDPVRMLRILAFLWPERYPDAAYHLNQSKIAFIHGGLTGVGLGNSIQKQFYLPEAHTDFILAIIGEELGLVASLGVLTAFLGVLICGLLIARGAPDPFGRLLAFGFTMLIVLQAAINVGVVTGCLPTKGLPLPFISYGGSSLAASLAAVGVLVNIARHGGKGYKDAHTRVIHDRVHEF